MGSQELERAVGIADHRLGGELGLILGSEGNAPAREAIELERGGAGLAKLLGPSVLARGHSAGAVHDDDGGARAGPGGSCRSPQIS